MTRLIRFRRIGGKATETRRYVPGTAIAAALAASIVMLAIGGMSSFAPIGAAFAQTAGTAGPVTINDLFTGDSVDLNPGPAQRLADAARKAQAPGQCPLGRLTFYTPAGDKMFQDALGAAQRDAVLAFLDRQGINASRFFADVKVEGTQSNVRLDYNVALDDIAPTLDVQWTPPKGTKVRAGTRITAKAVARDDANLWQTGIKTIDLTVDGGGPFGFEDFPQPPRTCESTPPPRTLDGVYTVPSNPPPLVRLRAIAKDFAGNETELWAEFPTGDWIGKFEWTHVCAGGGNRDETRGVSDLTLDHDGRGNLTGTLAGSTPERTQTMPTCSFTYVAPGTFSAKLVGSYTPGQDTFSAQAVEVRTTPGRASWTCPAGTTVADQAFFAVYEGPMFRNAFRDLRRQPDGSRKSSSETTFSAGGSTCTTTYSLTLRQAQN